MDYDNIPTVPEKPYTISVSEEDLERARRAVAWCRDANDVKVRQYLELFGRSFSEWRQKDLDFIRGCMRQYEEQEAGLVEDKLMYESRAALQWLDVGGDKDE